MLATEIKKLLHEGTVIPAHPLALNSDRSLDVFHQRLLTKYYLEAGAGGIAVGVHTTQFAIRDPKIDLYESVLQIAAEVLNHAEITRPFIKVAGVSGPTDQAIDEALVAKQLGYDIALLSMNGLKEWSEEDLLVRARAVGEHMPLFGFYLQPAVGGKILSKEFWAQFSEIPSVFAIKMAPFDRYHTLEVVRAVCQSSRKDDIALYTGNDDNIVNDLLTTYQVQTKLGIVQKDIVGGLLGHWAIWTRKAVELLEEIKQIKGNSQIERDWLSRNIQVTDANAAFFDARNDFKGCIAGIHEVLVRQGLMQGIWCLDPDERMSPGQLEEIDRVYEAYPEFNDDEFVKANINRWKSELAN